MQGHVFIDRDPKHFALILNFLRDGFAVLPRDEQALTEIMVEAAYYKVYSALQHSLVHPMMDAFPKLNQQKVHVQRPRLVPAWTIGLLLGELCNLTRQISQPSISFRQSQQCFSWRG